jgi:hypothetical protein
VPSSGLMEIKNWTTGEICYLDFKPRGWKASSAYQVTGKVVDSKASRTSMSLPDQKGLGRLGILAGDRCLKAGGVTGVDLIIPATTDAPLG